MSNKILTGSDFSGVGAFDQAIERLGIEQEKLFACDMDKYARRSYTYNFGTKADHELSYLPIEAVKPKHYSFYYPSNVYDREIPKQSLDIYMTSPPCQSFSLAGKRKGEESENGVLFYNSHEFIVKNKPRYFIFENVKGLLSDNGGKTFQTWCDMLGGKTVNGNPVIFPHEKSVPYHIYFKVLNAKQFNIPQNRERIFIIGIRDDSDNSFRWPKPKPLQKRLKDVLEEDVEEKYFLSEKMIKGLVENKENGTGYINQDTQASKVYSDKGQSPTLSAGSHGYANGYVKINSATKKGYEIATENDSINFTFPDSKTRRGREGVGVSQTLDTSCNQGVLVGAIRGRNVTNEKNGKTKIEQKLELNKTGTSNALTTVQKDNVLVTNLQGKDVSNPLKGKTKYGWHFEQNVYSIGSNCSRSIMAGEGSGSRAKIIHEPKIRRLTPQECFRLMDFNNSFKWNVSDTQAYKQAGNSIAVGVLAGIIQNLKF